MALDCDAPDLTTVRESFDVRHQVYVGEQVCDHCGTRMLYSRRPTKAELKEWSVGMVEKELGDEAPTCGVPLCPALPEKGLALCPLHRIAQLAKGLSYLKCESCKRTLKATDYIYRDAGPTRHVRCEPTTPRAVKDETKPLLEVIDGHDATDHRGAA